MNKTCNICGEVKPIGEYYKTSAQCKTCAKARGKPYYQDNKEAIAARNKQYYQDNKEATLARCKQYKQENKEAIEARKKQYREDNKEYIDWYRKQTRENMAAAVYLIANTTNGKEYIGQSSKYLHRWSQHKSSLRNNRHPHRGLQQDYNEYGKDAFVFEVIEEYPPGTSAELLHEREREILIRKIQDHKELYNTLT